MDRKIFKIFHNNNTLKSTLTAIFHTNTRYVYPSENVLRFSKMKIAVFDNPLFLNRNDFLKS